MCNEMKETSWITQNPTLSDLTNDNSSKLGDSLKNLSSKLRGIAEVRRVADCHKPQYGYPIVR